ncbi:MAG: CoA transferase [Acidimicrobiia bacterium]|nr:CaiB/BaiF CoA-transferase family protein [bacterium]MXW58557.1 CoA transferase [Acidimicrobiia bacterium]MYB73514.1 CoA transferase [Acidimicrobiia bacterium]
MGPLKGIRVVEIAGIGPGPFAAMMLADLGADVVRIDRADRVRDEVPDTSHPDLLNRGRRSVGIDLKHPEGADTVLKLVEGADGLIEGFRPGVAERLGIGPDACLARNPKLVYGRMTGWGQDGPYSSMAGHDINYIALSGVLGAIGREGEAPVPPVNLAGDFGGGGMLLALGMLAGMLEARTSGQGQVVDASMVEGSALLITMIYGMRAMGAWGPRGTNMLDTGAWFYDVYECADGEYISLGSLEPQFFAEMTEKTGIDADGIDQNDRATWPVMRDRLAAAVKTKTRDEWCEILDGSDVCFAPVLSLAEAPEHPHNIARGTFVEVGGAIQPGPAPRFSRTPAEIARPSPNPGQHTAEALSDWGFDPDEVAHLRASGAVR